MGPSAFYAKFRRFLTTVDNDTQRPATELLEEVHNRLHQDFRINHVTVQLEPLGFDEKDNCGGNC